MKRAVYKQPRQAASLADEWVKGERGAGSPSNQPEAPVGTARLTIDLPVDLRDRFKAACAMRRTKMVIEVRRFVEDWVQNHGNL